MIVDHSIDNWSNIDAAAARAVTRRSGVPARWVVATVRQSADAAHLLGDAIEQLAADDAPPPAARERRGAIDPALILLPIMVLVLFAGVTAVLIALQRAVALA